MKLIFNCDALYCMLSIIVMPGHCTVLHSLLLTLFLFCFVVWCVSILYMSTMYKCKIVRALWSFHPLWAAHCFGRAGPHSPSGSHRDWHETLCSRSKVISLHKLVVRYMPSVRWPSAKDNEGLVRMTEHQESQKQRKHRKKQNKRQCFLRKISFRKGVNTRCGVTRCFDSAGCECRHLFANMHFLRRLCCCVCFCPTVVKYHFKSQ